MPSKNIPIITSAIALVICFVIPTIPQSSSTLVYSNEWHSAGKIRRSIFTIKTGDDDLRGGDDNLNVAVNFRDGSQQWMKNVNHGQSCGNQTTHTFDIGLRLPVPLSEIASITFQTSFTGGMSGDNWNMASVSVRAVGDDTDKVVANHGFMRFTGDNKSLSLPVCDRRARCEW